MPVSVLCVLGCLLSACTRAPSVASRASAPCPGVPGWAPSGSALPTVCPAPAESELPPLPGNLQRVGGSGCPGLCQALAQRPEPRVPRSRLALLSLQGGRAAGEHSPGPDGPEEAQEVRQSVQLRSELEAGPWSPGSPAPLPPPVRRAPGSRCLRVPRGGDSGCACGSDPHPLAFRGDRSGNRGKPPLLRKCSFSTNARGVNRPPRPAAPWGRLRPRTEAPPPVPERRALPSGGVCETPPQRPHRPACARHRVEGPLRSPAPSCSWRHTPRLWWGARLERRRASFCVDVCFHFSRASH